MDLADKKALKAIKKGAEFRIDFDTFGFAANLMADDYVILHLKPGTCRNEACLQKVVDCLNDWSNS